MSTLTGPSSQAPNPLHPNADDLLGDDGDMDAADHHAVWKRRYHALQESVNADKRSKRKSGSVNLFNTYDLKPYSVENSDSDFRIYQ